MNKVERARRVFEHIETTYGLWLLDMLFELMFAGKLTREETKNLIESL